MDTFHFHVDPGCGDEHHAGLDPEHPWRTADHVVPPGSSVLFKRGSVIRGVLEAQEGTPDAPITYGAYGDGPPPLFLGSVPISSPASWVEASPGVWRYTAPLASEVCNLVFDNGERCGTLRWSREELGTAGDWFCDGIGETCAAESTGSPPPQTGSLYLRAPSNPGTYWHDIECVLWGRRHLVAGRRHVRFEDLAFRNSGVHGYHVVHACDVVLRRCDFQWIGGAVWHRERRIRFGNAIEFWNGACDVTVEDCTFQSIYDSGVTHQGGETRNIPERLFFRRNRFVDCGMAAYECREPSREVYFEGNDCEITGGGFGLQGELPPRQSEIHPQPMGHHVFIWRIEPGTQPGRVTIRNNRFGPTPHGSAIYAIIDPGDMRQFEIAANQFRSETRADGPPRKVRLATIMSVIGGSLDERLAAVDRLMEQIPAGPLDLVVFPETTLARGPMGDVRQRAVELSAEFGACARKRQTYVVLPMLLKEADHVSNAAVLFDRAGKVAGIYRKVHPVADPDNSLEQGVRPGGEFPVFECDFGKVGLLICWDMAYDDGWEALARNGAEIVVLSSASPQTVRPAMNALRHRYYVVTSTPRDNATLFGPIGIPVAQLTQGEVLVREIDLSYAILHWSAKLESGRALTRRFGERMGLQYSERENSGVFWSNDPAATIGSMIRELGLEEMPDHLERSLRLRTANAR
jgi:hypothetical protein